MGMPSLSRADLEGMHLDAIRKIARDLFKGAEKSQLAYFQKPELIDFVLRMINTGDVHTMIVPPRLTEAKVDEKLGTAKYYEVSKKDGTYKHTWIRFDEPEQPKHEFEVKPDGAHLVEKKPDLADLIADAVSSRIKPEMDEARVRQILDEQIEASRGKSLDKIKSVMEQIEALASAKSKEVTVIRPDGVKHEVGLTHYLFPKLLKLVQRRKNVFMPGPSGSGKTHVAKQVAEALGLPFYFESVGMQTTKGDLVGYNTFPNEANPTGYISTKLRQAYEHGGVFLLDEIDAGNPNVLTVINAMLANSAGSFPDRIVDRNKDFVFLAAGNTNGLGGDIQYVGRNKIDAATKNRFVVLYFGYDEKLEMACSRNKDWCRTVQKTRRAVEKLREKDVLVTPRASIEGADLIEDGFTEAECLEMLIYQGVNPEVKARIEKERIAA